MKSRKPRPGPSTPGSRNDGPTPPRKCIGTSTGLLAGLWLAAWQPAPAVDLRADTNRSGAIDHADEALEDTWSWQRGAVFLANCDADGGGPEPDHADAVVNGAADVADLAMLRLARIPELATEASVAIGVDAAAAPRVRIFLKQSDGTRVSIVPGSGAVPAAQLRDADVELGIEANSFATGAWNGEALVTATASGAGSDSVRLRVAPWLMLSNLHDASEVYIRDYGTDNLAMKNQMAPVLSAAGAALVSCPSGGAYTSNDVWMQDAFEVGCTEMPGVAMSAVLQSNRGNTWNLGRFAKDEMMAPGFGWFGVGTYRPTYAGGSAPDGWLDWFGNLEVTPPLPGHPYGRVYYGWNPQTGQGLDPAIVAMIDAQQLQGPALALDTGWLLIQHVDEMICWVPTGTPGKCKVLVPDTGAMYALLDAWVQQGLSAEPMLRAYEPTETVGAFRNDAAFRTTNAALQESRIEPMIDAIKAAWGLGEADIIRVPSAYYANGEAYVPAMVNALVANGHIFVSDPHGPEPAGADLMQADFVARLAAADVPLQVHFVDDRRYHNWSGNVHCATNARRAGFSPSVWERESAPSVEAWALH